MEKKDIKDNVRNIIAGILNISPQLIKNSSNFCYFETWDSMKNVMILSTIESDFDVEFPAEILFDLVSVETIVEQIVKYKVLNQS